MLIVEPENLPSSVDQFPARQSSYVSNPSLPTSIHWILRECCKPRERKKKGLQIIKFYNKNKKYSILNRIDDCSCSYYQRTTIDDVTDVRTNEYRIISKRKIGDLSFIRERSQRTSVNRVVGHHRESFGVPFSCMSFRCTPENVNKCAFVNRSG